MISDHRDQPCVPNRKILHVIPSLDRALGGTVECVRQMSSGIIELGYDVEILTLDDEINSRPKFFAKVISAGPRYLKYAFSIRLLWWLMRRIGRYDIVIVNGVWQFHAVAVWIAASINKIPFLVYPHGMITEYCVSNNALTRLKKLFYWGLVERRVLLGARAVLCTSLAEMNASKGYLPGSSKIQFDVVGNGIEIPDLNFDDGLTQALLSRHYLERQKYIIYLGRIDKIKGIDLLLRVYSQDAALRSAFHLVIAGPLDNGFSNELIDLARQLNIGTELHWIGAIHGDDKWRLLSCASALVLPSHHENFSIVVAEALAAGTPVLTTNKVGTSVEIMRYKAGFVADDTEVGVKDILKDWISLNDTERVGMRSNARLCFDECFRIDLPARRLQTIINRNMQY